MNNLLDRLCKLHRCTLDKLFQLCQEARLMSLIMLDAPNDRLYRAEDGTWWCREGNSLKAADPPPGWRKEVTS